ncbi:hypothetical protein FH972_020667 [Carpinus fangiana]|uniref:Malectin-like domain-containing protein n=1 Tax=Carpinus fangiana TaxID=176857 RepID=A0A5N6RTX2_9ROSI|nr:hypothetical protein FH972_020667 [Carpinus fangiana]
MTAYLMLLPLLAISVTSLIKLSFAVFVSIDCGGSNSSLDANSIKWTGDANYVTNGLPLISALELRSLGSKMYRHAGSNHVLSTTARFSLGSPKDIRYPTDPYDRLWFAYGATGPQEEIITSAPSAIDVSTAEDQPPKAVMHNAITATSTGIYINIYFTEVTLLNTTKRSIQLYMDNKPLLNPIVPPFGSVLQVYFANITASPNNTFTLGATSDSTLPPLINAYEVYKVGDFLPHRTNCN